MWLNVNLIPNLISIYDICIKFGKIDQIDPIAKMQKNLKISITFHPDVRSRQ